MCRKMSEVSDSDSFVADLSGNLPNLLVRSLQELVQNPQFVHNFKRRGMNRVATEVAKKVGVFLQHDHVDRHARQ